MLFCPLKSGILTLLKLGDSNLLITVDLFYSTYADKRFKR